VLFGAEAFDNSGYSVGGAGDVNGDGFDDVIIGALHADGPGNTRENSGESYLVFGGPSLPATIDLATLGSAGGKLFGASAGDQSGSVSGAGDVNGDGFEDLLIGAIGADGPGGTRYNSGASYLVFGGPGLPAGLDLGALGSAGVTLFGANTDDWTGQSVSGAGDVDGDGFDDILIGATRADGPGHTRVNSGETSLVFGDPSLPATLDLAALGDAGVTLFGADAGDWSGQGVSGAGDVNGDGLDDVFVGAHLAGGPGNARTRAGESYLVMGRPRGANVIYLPVVIR